MGKGNYSECCCTCLAKAVGGKNDHVLFVFSLFPGDNSVKKTLIIPQGAILLWSWRARKTTTTT